MGFYNKIQRLRDSSEHEYNGRHYLIDTEKLSQYLDNLEKIKKLSFLGDENVPLERLEKLYETVNNWIANWVVLVTRERDLDREFAETLFMIATEYVESQVDISLLKDQGTLNRVLYDMLETGDAGQKPTVLPDDFN